MSIQTTFANGINPFTGLGAMPTHKPEPTMQKPAKPQKTKRVAEDYSTPYAPSFDTPPASLHDANRPFGAAPMTKQPAKPTDPDTLVICNDPLPTGRASPGFKYAALFAGMQVGQCVKCKPNEIGRVAGALKKWLLMQPQGGAVRSIKNYGDGMGRVWWIAGQPMKRGNKPASH